MNALDRGSGVVPAEVAQRLDGVHVVPMAWEPWWSAGPVQAGPIGNLRLEIEMLGQACTDGGDLELPANLKLRDAKGVLALERRVTFMVHSPHIVFAELKLEDPALARRLGLPPPLDGSLEADPFEIWISLLTEGLRVTVASSRSGRCVLAHGAAPAKSACEQRFGGLIMAEDGPIVQKPLREQLAPGFAPADAVAALARDGLAIRLPRSAAMTRLHVEYEPADHACASEHDGGYRIAIPLHVALRSEDGVLSVRLGGFAETSVSRDGRWEMVEAQLDYTPLASLERSGFEAPKGAIALLAGSMSATASGAGSQALELHACKPGPNMPPYPSIADASLQRMSCYCDGERDVTRVDIEPWQREPVQDIAAPAR